MNANQQKLDRRKFLVRCPARGRRVGHRGGAAALAVRKGRERQTGLAARPRQVHRLRQLRHLLRAGRVGRQVRPQLHDVRLLRSVHRLLPARADRPEFGGGEPALPHRGHQAGLRRRPVFRVHASTSGSASAAASASRAATPSATARSTCRCGTTAAGTATSARSPSPAPRRPSPRAGRRAVSVERAGAAGMRLWRRNEGEDR